MTTFKQTWDIKMAMAVLENKTVDAELWTEAVEWLMLYGPPEIQDLLGQASSMATSHEFPELTPSGYNTNGSPLYNINDLAEHLGISVEKAKERLQQKEHDQNIQHLFSADDVMKIQ